MTNAFDPGAGQALALVVGIEVVELGGDLLGAVSGHGGEQLALLQGKQPV